MIARVYVCKRVAARWRGLAARGSCVPRSNNLGDEAVHSGDGCSANRSARGNPASASVEAAQHTCAAAALLQVLRLTRA